MISLLAWLVFFLLSFQIIVQLVFSIGRRRLSRPTTELPKEPVPISVIIAIKDEAANLQTLFNGLEKQVYPSFEVLFVNDGSVDETQELLDVFASKHDHVRVITTNDVHAKTLGGKKAALQTGIDQAKHEHMVFTDGDCEPVGEHWLTAFAHAFGAGVDVVVGSGFYRRGDKWFGPLYAMEALRSATMYHCLAGLRRPYMCVGRSLGYTRKAFKEADGFLDHADLLTGSDDLLLQSFPKHLRIRSVPSALTLSDPPPTARAWSHQRQRHLSAAPRYKIQVRGFLMAYDITLLLTPLAMIWGLVQERDILIWVLGLFIVRTLWSAINIQGIINLSGRPSRLTQLWPWEYPASWMNALISVASLWGKEREWKIDR